MAFPSLRWRAVMNILPEDVFSPEEKGELCFHVLVKETVSAANVQAATDALLQQRQILVFFPQPRPIAVLNTSEQRAMASLFRTLIKVATPRVAASDVEASQQYVPTVLFRKLGESKPEYKLEVKANATETGNPGSNAETMPPDLRSMQKEKGKDNNIFGLSRRGYAAGSGLGDKENNWRFDWEHFMVFTM